MRMPTVLKNQGTGEQRDRAIGSSFGKLRTNRVK